MPNTHASVPPTTAPIAVRERLCATYVPYSHHVTRHIIACDNMAYLATIQVLGRPADGYSHQTLHSWIEALHHALRTLPLGSVGMYSHVLRHRVTEYPQAHYSQPFAQQFDRSYRATFEAKGLMVNALYLSILVHPLSDPFLGSLARLEKADARRLGQWQAQAIERLQQLLRALHAALQPYQPRILGIVHRNGYAFSETAEFLGQLCNGRPQAMPVTRERIGHELCHARPVFSRYGELGELRHIDHTRLFGMIELRDYPEQTHPGHLDSLLELPCEFVLSQSWGSLCPAAARELVRKHRKLLTDSNDASHSQLQQLDQAMDDLTAGRLGLGEHHATLLLYHHDSQQLRQQMASTINTLAKVAIIAKPLERALEAGFWAQLPGNWAWRPRPVPVTSYNWLCLSSLHNTTSGKPAGNPWGQAVTLLKTRSGGPYFLNFHAPTGPIDETGKRLPGNTLIIGMTGTGKTVLQGMLLAQAQKFNATSIVWDKDQGLQVLIMALGGRYFKLRTGEATRWNPLQLPPNPANIALMQRLVAQLVQSHDEPLSAAQQHEINQAIEHLTSGIALPHRSLGVLRTLLPNHVGAAAATSVQTRLQPWCRGGAYGWLFDNPLDTLTLPTETQQAAILGFDLTELLEDNAVRAAATLYLRHRIQCLHDGRRMIHLFDECQHPLKDRHFQEDMQDASRTIRKKNGVLIFATQEPGVLLDNPVGPSLIQQAATLILLPNPQAKPHEYIEGFGLTAAEFEQVRQLNPASRQFVIKQGRQVCVATLDLGGCEDELHVLSGSPDMAAAAEAAIARAGPHPPDWLPIYLRHVKPPRTTHTVPNPPTP